MRQIQERLLRAAQAGGEDEPDNPTHAG
jgi:hypothetical protein